MHKSTYDILFKFFTSRLEPAIDETEREVILSTLSHLVAWKDDKSTHILCRDNYFCDELIPDFERFIKCQDKEWICLTSEIEFHPFSPYSFTTPSSFTSMILWLIFKLQNPFNIICVRWKMPSITEPARSTAYGFCILLAHLFYCSTASSKPCAIIWFVICLRLWPGTDIDFTTIRSSNQ